MLGVDGAKRGRGRRVWLRSWRREGGVLTLTVSARPSREDFSQQVTGVSLSTPHDSYHLPGPAGAAGDRLGVISGFAHHPRRLISDCVHAWIMHIIYDRQRVRPT